MKFSISSDENNIIVSHHGESILFNITALKRSKLLEPDKDLFAEINAYMDTLEVYTQFELYSAMRHIREVRDEDVGVSFTVQQQETMEQLKLFYEKLNLQGLEFWIKKNKHLISLPPDLISRGSEAAKQANHNDTINYYLEDYDGLIFLVIALRPMIGVWGEYIYLNKDSVGSKHKEYQAFKLLSLTNLLQSPHMDRLRFYIAETRATSAARNLLAPDAGVLDGVSSHSLNEYLLATLLVRKVAITNVNQSIISSVYSYLKNKINEASENFKVNPKHNNMGGGEDQRDRSLLENYKISTKLTYGMIEFMKSYISNPYQVALHIDPTIDTNIVEDCLVTNRSNPNFVIQEHMVTITQWLASKVFPPMGVYELKRNELIDLISVCQAVLIHWKIEHLPVLITAQMDVNMLSAVSTTRAGISDELADQLDKLFPYRKPGKTVTKKSNLAYEDIVELMQRLIARLFTTNVPSSYTQIFGPVNKVISCPLGIANLLALMVIKVNS